MLELCLFHKGLPENGSVFRRKAARGVVFREGKLLMIRTDRGDYKFPGGGVEPGETLEQALSREIEEETGFQVNGQARLWAVAHERRQGTTDDILEMDSYYFLCSIGDSQGELRLDSYEMEEHFHPVWITLKDALAANQKVSENAFVPWVDREIAVLQALEKESWNREG